MKKVLALVLAFAMMFSTITVAFAEDVVGPEAAALAKIEVLKGVDGVTVDYLKQAPTRLQAAIMLLRLKGLEDVAKEFVSEDNFADVKDYAWAEGKNMMAYLKANPTVGYRGTDNGFEPGKAITAKEFYKVLLVTLGYVEGSAEVVGDFTWDTVADKVKEVGLGKVLDVATFTNDDMAIATVEALKLKVKDSEKTLIEALVEADKVNEEKAIAAGLMEAAPALTAALKSAKAIGNTVVEVTFDAAINEGAADTALYSIEGLEIKDAVVTGEKTVRLETSAQAAGTKYTLVVGEVKTNFGGIAKVSGTPALEKVTGPDTELVELVFDKALDFVTATDVANYAIADVTIEKAELDGDTVTLTTNGLAANKTHTIKVTNVKSVDGVALKSASKSFYSKSDKVAPKVENAKALTWKRVLVTFNEELDEESAENIENYTIANLTVEKADLVEDDNDEYTLVELTTSAQKAGTSYTLKVNGVKDDSVLGNEIVKEQSARFTSKSEDKTGPTVVSVRVLSRNKVLVTFSDNSRLDFETVKDVTNYEFDKDITVEGAEMTPGFEADTKTAILTVSDLAEKTYYKLTFTGVSDEYGNEIKEVTKTINYNNVDLDAAKIEKVVATSATQVKVYFSDYINSISAKDVANYTINKEIGTPVSAKINADLNVVTLNVNELSEGTSYKLTINGLEDLAGNVLDTSASFIALTTENDIEGPEIEDITVVNTNVLRITFSESINIVGNVDDVEEATDIKANFTEADGTHADTLLLGAVYDDNTVLEFTNDNGFDDIEYKLTGFVNVKDAAGNSCVPDLDNVNFWGNTLEPDSIDFSWEQVNVGKYKFTFSEKVVGLAGFVADADEVDDVDMSTVWYLNRTVALDKVAYRGDINDDFYSNHKADLIVNTEEENEDETLIIASLDDEDAPYIENVKAIYRNEVEVTFNEDVRTNALGAYKISYYDLNGKLKEYSFSGTDLSVDENIVTIDLGSKLSLQSKYDYTLKVTTSAKDLAGNASEVNEEYSFMGTDLVAASNYITGVSFTNGSNFTAAFALADSNGVTAKVYEKDTNTFVCQAIVGATTSKKAIFDAASNALLEGKTYKVTAGSLTYEFDGIVADGIEVEVISTTEYRVSYDGMAVGDVLTDGTSVVYTVVNADVTNGYVTFAAAPQLLIAYSVDNVPMYFYEAE